MDAIQKRIVESLKNHPEFLDDKNILKGALMDIIPRDRLQVNVLIFAYELDVIKRLKGEDVGLVKASIISGLQANYGITKENAAWGVDTWCHILGIVILQKDNDNAPDDAYEERVKLALREVRERKHYREHQISINHDGQVIDNPEQYENIFLSCDINTIDLRRFPNLSRLVIDSTSTGDLFGIPIINELSIFKYYDWDYLKQLSFEKAEHLMLSICLSDGAVVLNLPKVKQLSLRFKNRDGIYSQVALNLSGCNNLEELSIRHAKVKNIDLLGELPGLKKLDISNSQFESLSWVRRYPQLESLRLDSCNISNISGVEELRGLKVIILDNNNIADLSPVIELPALEEIFIMKNTVDEEQIHTLRGNGVSVIATQEDKRAKTLEDDEQRFLESAIDMQLQEDDKPLDQFAPFLQKGILEIRKLPFEERLKDMIQRRFQAGFYHITPWRVWDAENNWEERDRYIKKKQELYPFLKVPAHMLEALSIDKKKFCASDVKNRIIFLGSENITCIEINEWAGKNGIKVKRWDDYKCSRIENEVVKNWPKDKLDYLHNRNFEVVITDKYALLEPEEVVYPIIISILAVHDGICDGRTAVIGQFKPDGSIKRETASLRNIGLSEKEGARNVLIYGSAHSYNKSELSKHNINYYYVKDYHEILDKMKAISASKYEQLSLMDFM